MKTGIYKIINKANGKYYIGRSSDIYNRWTTHRKKLHKNIHENKYLQRSWNKYGKENFEFLIIEEIPKELLLETEQKYLNISKTEKDKCYNLQFKSISYGVWNTKRKEKLNLFVKGHIPWNKGLKMSSEFSQLLSQRNKGQKISDEQREKISKKLKGRKKPLRSELHRINLSVSHKGKVHDEEHKRKISLSLKGHLTSNETRLKLSQSNSKNWKAISPNGNVVKIFNLRKFCIDNGLSQPNLFNVIKGLRKTHKGWKQCNIKE